MAINETVRDLNVNPNITKTVTLDLQKVIPTDTEGDEIYTVSATTTAVNKINGGSITPIFIRDFKAGYSKSSSFKSPPFTINSSNNTLRVSIDGASAATITLTSGVGLSGENISDDLQNKLNELAADGGSKEGDLGYLNATVDFSDNRFRVVSGRISDSYTGSSKSSVIVTSGLAGNATDTLGFDIPVESETLSSKRATETVLVSAYVSGTVINVASVEDYSVGEAFTITDGINREYFVAGDIDTNLTTITMSGSFQLQNDYDAGAVVQKIFERDPAADLASPYQTVDELVRFALRSLANQINFA